jgi:hypothetical protein
VATVVPMRMEAMCDVSSGWPAPDSSQNRELLRASSTVGFSTRLFLAPRLNRSDLKHGVSAEVVCPSHPPFPSPVLSCSHLVDVAPPSPPQGSWATTIQGRQATET